MAGNAGRKRTVIREGYVRFSTNIPEELRDRLLKEAERRAVNPTFVVCRAIDTWLQQHEGETLP